MPEPLKPDCFAFALCHCPTNISFPMLLFCSFAGGFLVALLTYIIVDAYLNRRKYRMREDRRRAEGGLH